MANLKIIDQRNVLGKDFKVYGNFENPLFLGSDVAEWIDYQKTSDGYYNTSKMLNTIDEEEKVTIPNKDSGGSKLFLTEDGLYEVLMQSRKPIAKKFKKEVKKILKTIRIYGTYAVPIVETIESYKIQDPMQRYVAWIKEQQELSQERSARIEAEKKLQELKNDLKFNLLMQLLVEHRIGE